MTPPVSTGFDLAEASVRIRGREILAPTTLQMRPGRICGVIGRNGAGKSTLLRLLARQIAPSSGQILLDGQDITPLPERIFARRVAFMAQGAPAIEAMSLRDLVALGRYPWHGAFGRMRPEDNAAVAQALRRTGLDTMAGRMFETLSGGEMQRARIAMMLAQESGWLILDEPSAALDLAWALDLLAQLRSLAREGKGIVIALHDMNLAARFCDDLLALRAGKVIGHGPVDQVFQPDLLSTLFDVPVTVAPVAGQLVALPGLH